MLLLLAGIGGFAAGVITCLAGVGGGITLVALLAVVLPARDVVALTAPVLIVGNLDRVWLFRREIDRAVVPWFAAGAVPAAALAGGLLADLPEDVVGRGVAVLLLAFVGLRVASGGREWTVRLPLPAFALVGAANAGVSAIAGGGGPLSAPFLRARGLTRGRFVGTESVCGVVINVVKTAVFAVAGLLTLPNLAAALVAAVAMLAGNRVGRSLLRHVSGALFERLLLTVLLVVALRELLGS